MTIAEYYQRLQAESFQDRDDCKERSALSVLYRNCEKMSFSQNQGFGNLIDEAQTDNEIDLIVKTIALVVDLK